MTVQFLSHIFAFSVYFSSRNRTKYVAPCGFVRLTSMDSILSVPFGLPNFLSNVDCETSPQMKHNEIYRNMPEKLCADVRRGVALFLLSSCGVVRISFLKDIL